MRSLQIVLGLLAALLLPCVASGQSDKEPPRLYTGNLGGGLALTNGNTDTRNIDLTAGLVRDPKTRVHSGRRCGRFDREEPGPDAVEKWKPGSEPTVFTKTVIYGHDHGVAVYHPQDEGLRRLVEQLYPRPDNDAGQQARTEAGVH